MGWHSAMLMCYRSGKKETLRRGLHDASQKVRLGKFDLGKDKKSVCLEFKNFGVDRLAG